MLGTTGLFRLFRWKERNGSLYLVTLFTSYGLCDHSVVQVLLEFGGDIHGQTSEGYTPLHVAAMCGRVDAVKKLLDYGADPLVYDDEDMLPLELAREAGEPNCFTHTLHQPQVVLSLKFHR